MINFKKRERGTPTFSSYRRRALPTYSHYSLSDIRCMDRQITYLFIFIFFVTGKYIYIYITCRSYIKKTQGGTDRIYCFDHHGRQHTVVFNLVWLSINYINLRKMENWGHTQRSTEKTDTSRMDIFHVYH